MKNIKGELGNPSVGAIAEVMPLIEAGVRKAFGEKPAKEARVTKPAETRSED
tara:strand:+ start:14388 stop:14543 length:156 start_codon:yes stop_codon:yes gene_type:complete